MFQSPAVQKFVMALVLSLTFASVSAQADTQCFVEKGFAPNSTTLPMRVTGATSQSLVLDQISFIVGLNEQGQPVSFTALANHLQSVTTRIDGTRHWMSVSTGTADYGVDCKN